MSPHPGRLARREIAAGLVLLTLAAAPTLEARPPEWELHWFGVVNRLPDGLHSPVWAVMQLGALGAVPATAAVALLAGNRRLATRLAVGGTVAWATAKVVKRVVARARPEAFMTDARVRGRRASGLGFPSGHAGVATALTGAALASVQPRLRAGLVGLAVTVAAARVYVGVHLPMDVLGGAALGFIVDGTMRLGGPGRERQPEDRAVFPAVGRRLGCHEAPPGAAHVRG
jgi:undecaprenyl-diphosphatase